MSQLRLPRAILGALFAMVFMAQPLVAAADNGTQPSQAWPIAPTVSQEADARIVAQTTPVARPKHMPLWPSGLDYTVDAAMAWAFGKTGAPSSGLPGGMDVIFRYSFSPNNRLVIGYYDLQEYPLGFSSGTVPVFLQGVATPIATANLAANNATVQNHLIISHWDQIVWTKLLGQDFPLIISPTYTHRWGSIGGGTDYLPVEINGLPYMEHYRTGDFLALALTIPVPVLTQPKFHLLTTYSVGPQWVLSSAGANQTNTAQLVQILHLQWHPSPQIQIDLQPSLYPNLLPTDQWPQHYLTMIYSAAYSFGRPHDDAYGHQLRLIPFVQGTISMGGAMNESPYGITALYCQALPCTSPSQLVPQLGGNHAAQFQLKLGIGRPDVIPL
ncbi:MAG: hypothetical protein ACRENA_01765 [Vulcanimicrobiaceae bacterium]